MLKSHLTVLESSTSLYPSSPVFKIPQVDSQTGQIRRWESINYRQFAKDVERFARHWRKILAADNIPQNSVIGLWLGGMTYTDALHIYGLSRAGYIPQLFSLRLPSPVVIFELLQKTNAAALIYETPFESGDCPVPIYQSIKVDQADASGELNQLPVHRGDDIAFIFHTSGSTSGSPKLVPCSYRWVDSMVNKSFQLCQKYNTERQDVSVWIGSMCHMAQTFMLIGHLQHGSCVIQPTSLAFSSDELVDMILRCGLSRLAQFATYLAVHLRNSRNNPKLLSLLVGLDEVFYTGLSLARDEEEWALRNGVKIKNCYANTECGAMLVSCADRGRHTSLFRPLDGMSCEFVPIDPSSSESGHQSTARLLELVILSSSPDCPDVSLRHPEDGHFHTGDLFQEVMPRKYVFCGRNDDWIKSENSLRCDTKAIEDNVRAMCGDLVQECVVVGTGRPWPALFIEPAGNADHDNIKKQIIRKTRQFHSRRYLHERITSPDMIIIVAPKSLPRTATKGNIRRKAVEEAYKTELDRLYSIVKQ